MTTEATEAGRQVGPMLGFLERNTDTDASGLRKYIGATDDLWAFAREQDESRRAWVEALRECREVVCDEYCDTPGEGNEHNSACARAREALRRATDAG